MQGKGKIGLALQETLGQPAAAPTVTLRVRQFADPMPKYIEKEDEIALGNRFGSQSFVQGIETGQQQLRATATERELLPLLTAILAAPNEAGLIVPRPDTFGAGMPGQPLTIWQQHPLMNSLFVGAQLTGITLNMPTRDNVEITVSIMTAGGVDFEPSEVVFPPVPADVIQFLHWYLKIGDQLVAPESGSIEINQKMSVSDGAQGLHPEEAMNPLGMDLDGQLDARCKFKLHEAGAVKYGGDLKTIVALSKPGAGGRRSQQRVETGFEIAGKKYVFTLPNAEIRTTDIPNGTGKIVVGLEAVGVGLGVPPVTVQLPAAG